MNTKALSLIPLVISFGLALTGCNGGGAGSATATPNADDINQDVYSHK